MIPVFLLSYITVVVIPSLLVEISFTSFFRKVSSTEDSSLYFQPSLGLLSFKGTPYSFRSGYPLNLTLRTRSVSSYSTGPF